jgi:tripartite-type tricarboxylate transporter receptor subunit TctC
MNTFKMGVHRFGLGIVVASLAGLGMTPAPANGQTYPSKPITLAVPFGAGSTTDIYARALGEALAAELGQPVVVDNKAGAGGSIGIGQALRAPADGHTLMLVTTSTVAINASLYQGLSYSPAKDISVVAIPSTTPNVLVVPVSTPPLTTYPEFERKFKDGREHFYNSQGAGTSQHLSSVLLTQLTGIKASNVAYKGADALTGMIGGQTEFAFATVPSVLSLIKGGKLNALAVSGSKSFSLLPEVPTMLSFGYRPFGGADIWYGIGVNSKTPAAVKEKLALAVSKVVKLPRVQTRLAEIGFDPMPEMSPASLQHFVDEQIAFWGRLVRDSGAKAD